MQTITVSGSSNVKSLSYQGSTLTVEYLTGSKYEFYGLPSDVIQGLKEADSKGSYIAANIRGVYEYKKL